MGCLRPDCGGRSVRFQGFHSGKKSVKIKADQLRRHVPPGEGNEVHTKQPARTHNPSGRTRCIVLLVTAAAYSALFGLTRHPTARESTLSWIGYDHPFGFLLWGGLMAAALFCNLRYAYEKYGCRNRLGLSALYAAPFMMPPLVLINDWGWEQSAHLAATIAFVLFNTVALFLLLLRGARTNFRYKVLAVLSLLIPCASIAMQAILGSNGLMELLPLLLTMLLLGWINFTERLPIAESVIPPYTLRKSRTRALRLARYAGIFGAHDFYLGNWDRGTAHLGLTYIGLLFCLNRLIGVGNEAQLQGEGALIFLAIGIAALSGSLTWGICDTLELRRVLKHSHPPAEGSHQTYAVNR